MFKVQNLLDHTVRLLYYLFQNINLYTMYPESWKQSNYTIENVLKRNIKPKNI